MFKVTNKSHKTVPLGKAELVPLETRVFPMITGDFLGPLQNGEITISQTTTAVLPDGNSIGMIGNVVDKFYDDFGGDALDLDLWDVLEVVPGITYSVALSNLTINMGTDVNAELHITSKKCFTIPVDLTISMQLSQKLAANNIWIELVECDPLTGELVPHATIPDEVRNRAGMYLGVSTITGNTRYESMGENSPELLVTAGVTMGPWTSAPGQDVLLEYRPEDLMISNVLGNSGIARNSNALRASTNFINPNRLYKMRMRFKNSDIPATATTVDIKRVICCDTQEIRVEVSGGRGHLNGGQAIATAMVGPVTIAGTTADNASSPPLPILTSGMMTTTAGGPAVGTSGRAGSIQIDGSRRQITQPMGNAASHRPARLTNITAATEQTLLAAQGATLRAICQSLTITNNDNVDHVYDIRDAAAGTIRETVRVKAGSSMPLSYPAGWPATSLNAAWTIQARVANTVGYDVTGSFFVTTG